MTKHQGRRAPDILPESVQRVYEQAKPEAIERAEKEAQARILLGAMTGVATYWDDDMAQTAEILSLAVSEFVEMCQDSGVSDEHINVFLGYLINNAKSRLEG